MSKYIKNFGKNLKNIKFWNYNELLNSDFWNYKNMSKYFKKFGKNWKILNSEIIMYACLIQNFKTIQKLYKVYHYRIDILQNAIFLILIFNVPF